MICSIFFLSIWLLVIRILRSLIKSVYTFLISGFESEINILADSCSSNYRGSPTSTNLNTIIQKFILVEIVISIIVLVEFSVCTYYSTSIRILHSTIFPGPKIHTKWGPPIVKCIKYDCFHKCSHTTFSKKDMVNNHQISLS